MGMKRCKYCEAEVATSTVYCIKCGGKLKLRTRDILLILLGIFAVVCCFLMYGCSKIWGQAKQDVAAAERRAVAIHNQKVKAEQDRKMQEIMAPILAEQERHSKAKEAAAKAAEVARKAKAEEDRKADIRAIGILKMRIEKGSVAAKYSLAIRYIDGNGVEVDKELGLEMLKECAAEDHAMAKKKLRDLGEQ